MPRGYHVFAAVLTIAVLAIWAAEAPGQVDHRVNRGSVGGTGQALDANPLVGSSGLNRANLYSDFGARSNALISGNLSGLASFKGGSPIPTGNSFRLSLPSAGLSSFQGQSVGIPDLRPGGVPSPTYFFGREQTISDLGYIRQSLNEPGSSMLRSPNTAPQLSAQPQTRDISTAIPDPVDLRVDVDRRSQLSEVGIVRLERPSGAISPTESTGGLPSPYDRAVDSSLFGIPDVRSVVPSTAGAIDATRTAELAGQRHARERGASIDEDRGVQPVDTRVAPRESDRIGMDSPAGPIDQTVPGIREPAEVSSGFEVRQTRPGEVLEETDSTVVQGRATLQTPAPARDFGRDRFTDMTRAIEAVQRSGVDQLGFAPVFTPGRSGEADSSERDATADSAQASEDAFDDAIPLRRQAPIATGDLGGAIKWAADVLESPITTFAGTYEDRFNQAMAAGEQALRDGRYYDAARQFDLAATIDPGNPLPLLHRGHALIAAGDFMSASRALQAGIRRFPQIAAFRIDLPAMAGKTTIFDIRRADLEGSLKHSDYYELRFLLGYLELYSGLPELGIENLESAAKAAPPDSVIASFADLVLGRKPLPSPP